MRRGQSNGFPFSTEKTAAHPHQTSLRSLGLLPLHSAPLPLFSRTQVTDVEAITPPPVSPTPNGEMRGKTELSRRDLIRRVVGIALITAVGVPTMSSSLAGPSGKLGTPLLAARPFYVAHRGGSADWPEMSLYAYAQSVARNVDALEISLARTSDGVWFGLHDKTLDRTSGTRGFTASAHTWAEAQRYKISGANTTDPTQAAQPYISFDQLVKAYGTTHSIFVDPKWAPSKFYPELLNIMDASVTNSTQTFIAKAYCTSVAWATAAHNRGYQTWGYYYGTNVDSHLTPLATTQGYWDLLGMDYGGSISAWTDAASYGKLIIGHVIPNKTAAATAVSKGAAGLILSGVAEVLAEKKSTEDRATKHYGG